MCTDISAHISLTLRLTRYATNISAHVIVVTQARVRCLICMHDARGRAATKGECGHIGNARVPVLQLICYTSGTLKSVQIVFLTIYIGAHSRYDCGICI